MVNEYLTKILVIIVNSTQDTIMVHQYKLTDSDCEEIKKEAIKYNKTIIFATLKDIIFNNDNRILVIE